ncbi:related to monophenol monooxygenase [Fusarium fujikuroi IMI 58289]|uniref:Related to monophenol monooxygenase n=1 Tax=Gibberella fujikuroi (strain CBS 195.34 / IMI 58289 / NRRL A-6831) TaxID=1279085 RepID=S0EGX6_GIBF5|nr:related to monophenol monooxygenase [Fusarium fujikuroi IMI 58289]CCT73062.1 related to monophenol monooxygenase [Fusarium fujikuroi IMI 58289]SCO17856.1 related to monophenol monooxygenase [Fusarium fujikuroi]
MHVASLLATALLVAVPGSCALTHDCGCKAPLVRKEWRTLSTKEKHDYIGAVKCLATKPSQTGNIYAGAKSRYDDFQVSHIVNTDFIHYVGFFQAWHRMFIAQYEKDLRDLCCYSGGQPYWDWTLDSNSMEDFESSPIFDAETGFGGNGVFIDISGWTNVTRQVSGRTGGGCVTDGPFAKGQFEVHAGPDNSTAYKPRCLARDISVEYGISKLNQTVVDGTLEAKDFFEFDQRVQGGVSSESQGYHGGGHLAIGGSLGEMGDMYSSPGDPIFWLHHTNVDRLWDIWQRLDWPARKSDISGPDTQYAYPYDFFGDKAYKNITLAYVMDFGNLLPDRRYVTVEEAMDTRRLCYTYE